MITPDMLCSLPIFAMLDAADLQDVAAAAADVHLVACEWLISEGEQPAFFVLLEGGLEVTKSVGGNEQIINHYEKGDYFGEVPILLGTTAIANLRAETDARVLRLDADDFHTLVSHSEKFAAKILQTMTRRVQHLQHLAFETPANRTLIVGRPADLECHDLRQFLAGNHVSYRWLDPDDPLAARSIPAQANEGPYPVVVLPDDTAMKNPSRRDIADRLGLQTKPTQKSYDVVIVGGGPAGLAAAVYGASEGLRTLMIEREAPGGQAGTSSRIENYLGFPTGLSGDELGTRALQQAKRFGTEIVVARNVTRVRCADGTHWITLNDQDEIETRTIILATGVSWRTLDVPGADKHVSRGIYYGAARTEALSVRGKDVYLIGGGNSAGQAAMFFSSYASCVTLLIRGETIEAGMSQYLIDQLRTKDNVRVQLNTGVQEVHGEAHLEAITTCDSKTGATARLETDSLFVFIGADAETAWLPDDIARDDRGYLLTGADAQASGKWRLDRDAYLLESSVPGIFAAGDVRHGSVKRVASGVGEGSMAIAFIHQYLAQAPAEVPQQ